MVDASVIGERYAAVRRSLDERGRRLFVTAEARTAVHRRPESADLKRLLLGVALPTTSAIGCISSSTIVPRSFNWS